MSWQRAVRTCRGVLLAGALCSLLPAAATLACAQDARTAGGDKRDGARTAATSPDSIGRAQFAALIARLSAPAGYFDTDNLISNESSYLHPLTVLDSLGVHGGGYIGVGPDQNFSYIARVEPVVAFVVDIRRDNMLHHLLLKALIELSLTRAEYVARLTGRPVPRDTPGMRTLAVDSLMEWAAATAATPRSIAVAQRSVQERIAAFGVPLDSADRATIARFHRAFIESGIGLRFTSTGRAPQPYYPTLGQLFAERDLSGAQSSYVATERAYQRVRQLQLRNMIVPVVGDLSGPALGRVGNELRARGLTVSVLYVSNVEDYLIRDARFARYSAAVSELPRDTRSELIRSWFGGPMSHPMNVRGYYTTQLVQPLDALAASPARLNAVTSYRGLVSWGFLGGRQYLAPISKRKPTAAGN